MGRKHDLKNLRNPAIVVAFGGWNDAGEAATDVIEHLAVIADARLAFDFGSDDFYDFQINRPMWSRTPDGDRVLTWPAVDFLVARLETRDVVLVVGPEPNLRWREFCAQLLSLFHVIEPEIVILLGSMLTDAPHSRAVPVSRWSTHPDLSKRFGLQASDYEGPTGILGVLAATAGDTLPVVSLWASTPHYVADPPNPKATLALLNEVEDLLDTPLDPGDLPERSLEWQRNVDEMAGEDADISAYITSLEERRDSVEPETTGDAIAAEFQRYLRRRNT